MKQLMDKLLAKIKVNKKTVLFLTILGFIALVSGSVLVVILDKSDKTLINNYLTNFINDVANNKIEYIGILKNSLISNIGIVLIIWLLGISVIGVPIILFLYFSQIFSFGFGLASIILNYKIKGIILAIIYTFPHYLVLIFILIIVTAYSMSLSLKFISAIIKKKQLDFKIIFSKYLFILLFSVGGSILFSLYETFAFPNIIKLIIPILN